MLNEFIFMTAYLDEKNLPEMWTSSIIEKWLTENPELLQFEAIEKSYKQIQTISQNDKE